ncbi:MAG: phenylalanine--tRNA ligase subunit alpha [Defluviitaleaceae bacterium]|nr:phenylalanine--tRNA ligase subunit alpha [Defluviitaleaceae bacterium]
MRDELIAIRKKAEDALSKAQSPEALEDMRVWLLGKKGELTQILKSLGKLSAEERPAMGQLANDVRLYIEARMDEARRALVGKQREIQMQGEQIDVTMPGAPRPLGRKHPMTIVMDELKDLFIGMGFEIAEGPDVELDYYNFEALNIPANHPAKDEQDTFYVEGGLVLRTQTSSVQVRVMEKTRPPIKIIAPGTVYRSDAMDATHSPVFNQIEGLVVDKGITFGDLKGSLNMFARQLFGENTVTRFRPHHFPFTEPSAEMDISCFVCGGKGCRVCKDSGWIELGGCGLVHPNVLKMQGIDPEVYSGWAFGFGIERMAMAKFGVSDLRLLFENDVRFLRQFA